MRRGPRSEVRGLLSAAPAAGTRLVCYCDDCQSFQHWLERADDVLDPLGGTEIFQTSPARVRFESGRQRVGCMHLRSRGLARWFTRCCRTPIGNTLRAPTVPFVGVIWAFIGDGDATLPLDAVHDASGALATRPEVLDPETLRAVETRRDAWVQTGVSSR